MHKSLASNPVLHEFLLNCIFGSPTTETLTPAAPPLPRSEAAVLHQDQPRKLELLRGRRQQDLTGHSTTAVVTGRRAGLLPGILASGGVAIGHVSPNGAAACSPEHAMPGHVACDATGDRALDAAGRLCGRRSPEKRGETQGGDGEERFHGATSKLRTTWKRRLRMKVCAGRDACSRVSRYTAQMSDWLGDQSRPGILKAVVV